MKRSSTLTFNGIRKKDIDVYTCVIENECTGLTKIGEVDIHAKLDPCSGKFLIIFLVHFRCCKSDST